MFSITSFKLEEYHSHLSLIHVFMVVQAHTHSLTHTHTNLHNKSRYEADDKQVEEPFLKSRELKDMMCFRSAIKILWKIFICRDVFTNPMR